MEERFQVTENQSQIADGNGEERERRKEKRTVRKVNNAVGYFRLVAHSKVNAKYERTRMCVDVVDTYGIIIFFLMRPITLRNARIVYSVMCCVVPWRTFPSFAIHRYLNLQPLLEYPAFPAYPNIASTSRKS